MNNSFGRNNSYTEIAWATVEAWQRDAQFLVAMARLVTVTNPQQAFQRDQLARLHIPTGPGSAGGFNHPNTFTPYSNQAAIDRISERNARAPARSVIRSCDPSTGRPTRAPRATMTTCGEAGSMQRIDPTQLLQVVPPGTIDASARG